MIMARFRCSVCGWVFDEEKEGKKFSELPDDWVCPVCGAPKGVFVEMKEGGERKKGYKRASEMIVETLEAAGVKHVYGIPGESNLPLIEAIRKSSIKFILTRHEETAAFMASAHGKMTDEVGVCLSIAGPGCTNLITGLLDAENDRAPVLAFLGQIPEIRIGSEALQEMDQIELFRTFAEYAETLAKPDQDVIGMALKYAYRKPGVSVISTPTDVLDEPVSSERFLPEKRISRVRMAPEPGSIERAADLINSYNRVAILAGWGARHCGSELLELAERLKAPLFTTSRAKGTVPENHRLCVGVLGSLGTKQAVKAISNSELLLVVGSGFRQSHLTPGGAKVVQIDTDPVRIGRTYNVDAPVVGDSLLSLKALLSAVKEKSEDKDYMNAIQVAKGSLADEIDRDCKDVSIPINPGYLVQAIKRNVRDDAILCVDVGDHTFWLYRKFVCDKQRFFLSANMASMGFALPAALSAKLDFPDKQVICVTGDGGFGMLMADFTTAVREGLKIDVVIFNDGKLKNIMKEQLSEGYEEFATRFPNPDFARFAESCGGFGARVTDPRALDGALRSALDSDKPSIVDVIVEPLTYEALVASSH
jgi:pyruvate oxidase